MKTTKFNIHKMKLGSLIFLLCFLLASCKENPFTKKVNSLKGVLTLVKGTVLINGVQAKLNDIVRKSDKIETKKKAGAVIQFSEGALITVKSKTKLEISSLVRNKDGKDDIAVFQTRGSTFNKITSGKARFSISSVTLTAGVRGTAFSFTVGKNKNTELKLLEGSVELSPKKKIKGQVEEARIVEIPKKGKPTPIGVTYAADKGFSKSKKLVKKEVKRLQVFNEIAFLSINDLEEGITAEKSKKEVIGNNSSLTKELISEEILLERELQDNTELSKIITKDGKVYIGSFLQRGKIIKLKTREGKIVTLAASQLKKILHY